MLFRSRQPNIYISLDEDAKDKELGIAKKLREYNISVKTFSVAPYADIGEMTKEQVEAKKQNADFVSDLDYLKYKLNF